MVVGLVIVVAVVAGIFMRKRKKASGSGGTKPGSGGSNMPR